MTIEEFERGVREAYVNTGRGSALDNWFSISYYSHYKSKLVSVTELRTGIETSGNGEKFQECFESVLNRLNEGE